MDLPLGPDGAHTLLQSTETICAEVLDPGVACDVDTPEAYRAVQASQRTNPEHSENEESDPLGTEKAAFRGAKLLCPREDSNLHERKLTTS